MSDRLIVVTAPEFFDGEAEILNHLFESGLTRLHIRKPQSRKQDVERLISEIDFSFRTDVIIHYHSDLVSKMGLGGMHFSFPQIKEAEPSNRYTISCSVHQWSELNEVQDKIDYCFMSPVFNSISKMGYQANENLLEVPSFARNVFALGGITDANFKQVLDYGYSGIAVLGYLWTNKVKAVERFNVLKQKLQAYGN